MALLVQKLWRKKNGTICFRLFFKTKKKVLLSTQSRGGGLKTLVNCQLKKGFFCAFPYLLLVNAYFQKINRKIICFQERSRIQTGWLAVWDYILYPSCQFYQGFGEIPEVKTFFNFRIQQIAVSRIPLKNGKFHNSQNWKRKFRCNPIRGTLSPDHRQTSKPRPIENEKLCKIGNMQEKQKKTKKNRRKKRGIHIDKAKQLYLFDL